MARSRGNNNNILGYSQQSLAALERKAYGKGTGRKAKYNTSQEQLRQANELPMLKRNIRTVEGVGRNQNTRQTTKPSTRYNDTNIAESVSKPKQTNRDTRFDKDFDNFYNYRYGDFSGEIDYDPVLDMDVEKWRNVKKDIMAKNKWTEKEFDTRWNEYDKERSQKMANQEVQSTIDFAKEHPLLGTLVQAAYTPQTMIEGGAAMLSNLLPNKYKAQSAEDPMFTGTRAKEGAKQAIKDNNIKSDFGKGAYDIGTSLGDMLLASAVPVLGTASLGTQTAARTNMQALERGVDPTKAAATAGASGVISGLANKVGLDWALGSAGKTALGTVGKAALREGLENVAEDALNLGVDAAINKNKSQLNTLHDYYVGEGLSDDDAWNQVIKDTGLDLVTSFGSGAAFGGVMQGVRNLPSLIGGKVKGNKVPQVEAEIDNAIKQTAEAQAKIQELSEQIPKVPEVTGQSAPKISLTPQEAEAINANRPKATSFNDLSPEQQAEIEAEMAEQYNFEQPKAEVTKPENKVMNESAGKNPTYTFKPLEGDAKNQANTEYKDLDKQLSKDDYDTLFDGRQGIANYFSLAKHFAGDTPEAEQLAKDANNLLKQYVQSGNIDDYYAFLGKVGDLSVLAEKTRKDYVTQNGTTYKYDDIFYDTVDDPSLGIRQETMFDRVDNGKIQQIVDAIHNAPEEGFNDGQLTPEEVRKLEEGLAESERNYPGEYPTEAPQNEVPNVKPTEPQAPTEAPKVPEVTNVPPQNPPTDIGTTPANGEEKIRSFSERGSKDKSLPDEVRKELKEDTYSVVRNADVEARTDELFDGNDLIQTRSNLEQAIKNHDPVAAPLSYRLAKAYVDAKQYDAANDVIETVSAELTRSGQFTQAAKLAMMQNDPMAALRAYKRDINNINQWGKEKYGKKWTKLELSKEDIDAFNSVAKGDKEALNNVVNQINAKLGKQVPASLWDKLVAGSKTAMLLNLRTQGRNVVSNMAMLPVRSASDRVSALGQNIAHLINPDIKVTQSITGGTKEQKEIAEQIFEQYRDSILNENKYKDSTKSDILSNRQIFNDDFFGRFVDRVTKGGVQKLNEKLGANGNKSTMETLSNLTYYLMGDLGDTPFVKKNFVNRLASYMKAQGINNIDDVPDDAIAIATEEALKATFKDDNAFSNALAGIKKKSGKFGEIALPFVKTPANLAVRGYDYSPAGIISTIKMIKSGADANKVIDNLAKNLTGTAMIYLGYKLREKGLLSGNYSEDADEKAWQKQQGMFENAIHIGDNYYTFDWAQPSSTPLILGSVIYDAVANSDSENFDVLNALNSAYTGATAVGNSWLSTSPIQSLSDMLGGDQYGDKGGVTGNILNEVIEFPQRFMPAQVGATARTIDPVIRDTYTNDNTLTGILGNQVRSFQSKVPYLSQMLPASYDSWGNERTRNDTQMGAFLSQNLNPGQYGNKNETPLDAEITRIYNATGNKDVFPLSAARSLNLGNDGNIKLTNKQHSDYQKMLGQQSYKFADAIMNNNDYKSLSDDEKTKALKEAYDFSNALAKEKLFNHATDDGLKKIKEAFEKDGEKGVANFLMEKAKADKLGLDIDTYQKNQAEYEGGAEQYAKDKKIVDAINEKYDTEYTVKSFSKYGAEGLDQRAQDSNSAIEYGFVNKEGNANTDLYEKAEEIFGNDTTALKEYADFHKKGYTKNAQMVPALQDNNNLSAEQKGKVIMAEHGYKYNDLGKAAKGAYDVGGEAGVWYYYMLKNYADTDGKSGLSKKEKAALKQFMQTDSPYVTQIPDNIFSYLGNLKNW